MRAITIANVLQDMSVCFMGSSLSTYQHLIPKEITCLHLPSDVPEKDKMGLVEHTPSFLHYAPVGVQGQRERTALITEIFKTAYPLLLVVDVSVEITLLARLCGIPAIVIRQHGERDDLAHLQAYESAELLIAPFSKSMSAPSAEVWVDQKTLYAGGFSRYNNDQLQNNVHELRQHIAILIGEGGTSITERFIKELAKNCPAYTFHVIGQVAMLTGTQQENIIFHGKLAEPATVISTCAVVIGNAGHNTVMEMAALNKRFICIPEDRPFKEQEQKARILARNGNARVIPADELQHVNWQEELETILNQTPDWTGVIAEDALPNIRRSIDAVLQRLFQNQPD